MKKKQEVVNQVFFVFVVLFIIFLLWGYGSGWLGASADVAETGEQKNVLTGIVDGVNDLREKSIFKDELQTPSDKLFSDLF